MKESLLSLVALAILSAVIWFGGQHLAVPEKTRIIIIGAAAGVWLLLWLIQRILAIRASALIERRLRAQAQEQVQSSRPAEREQVTELEKKLGEALEALKASRLGKAALADMPWYIVIGPPGSGKSTALQKSGLNFPQVGQGLNGIQGVGGTRNCEWWFTDEGVLLDTAGRYTTELEDREEWLGFLDLLKSARARKPINGAIVALSVPDLVNATDAELEAHAKAVRDRLDELGQKLELVFPVYVMFTKCDLIDGFVDFFEDFTREQRGQAWGWAQRWEPLVKGSHEQVFDKEIAALEARLAAMRLPRLAADRHPRKKQKIFEFPLQFGLARRRLREFIGAAFRANPFKESPILRGVYFSSGTQEGVPIDALLGAMRQAFALGPRPAGQDEPVGEKKSYFITDLFRKVIFADRGLARSSAAAERRRRLSRWGGIAASVLATVAASAVVLASYAGNAALVGRVKGPLARARAAREARADGPTRVEALEALREPMLELDHNATWLGPPVQLRFGLYQGDRLDPAVRVEYLGGVRDVLLTPAVAALSDELRELSATEAATAALAARYGYQHEQELYDGLYRRLRLYLFFTGGMQGGTDDLKPLLDDSTCWLRGLGPEPPATARALARIQIEVLAGQLDRPHEWAVRPDEGLVERVKKKLEANFWVTQSYTQVRDVRMGLTGQETLESLIPTAGRAALRAAGGVSKVFSAAEWDQYFRIAVDEKSTYLAEQYANLKSKKTKEEIQALLRQQYVEDGFQRWKRFVDGLEVTPPQDVREAVQLVGWLADPAATPLPALFRDVWPRQQFLDAEAVRSELLAREQATTAQDPDQKSWHERAQKAWKDLHAALSAFASSTEPGRRFWPLAQQPGGLAKLDPVRDAFSAARTTLLEGVLPKVPPTEQDLARRLFTQALERSRDAFVVESQREANAWWAADVHAFVGERLTPFFPLANVEAEVALADLEALLKPEQGALWATRAALGRLAEARLLDRPLVAVSTQTERTFTGAEPVRDALFAPGGAAVSVGLQVKLIKREGVRNVRLTLGKESFKQDDLPPGRLKALVWSRDGGDGALIAVLAQEKDEWVNRDFTRSPWGLVRLLATGQLVGEDAGRRMLRFSFAFDLGGRSRSADVELTADREASLRLLRGLLWKDWVAPPPEVGP